jgi:hypothetical protein
MWSFADRIRAFVLCNRAANLPSDPRIGTRTLYFLYFENFNFAFQSGAWIEMGGRQGRNDRIRQNRSQYVSISLICFKMRKREQRFPLLPFKHPSFQVLRTAYTATPFYCRTRYGAALQATVPVVVRVVTPAVLGSKCNTPSSEEQKRRTPVWLKTRGAEPAP